MKTKIAVIVLCCASWSWGCPKDSVEWKGNCAAMPKPEGANVDESKWVSNEKPPRGKMPSYQREGIHAAEIPSFKTEAEEADAQIKYANAHSAKGQIADAGTGKPSQGGKQ
jgi:hypothetical protein